LDTGNKLGRDRRRRIKFDSQKEADAHATELRKKIELHGIKSMLTAPQQADALTALTTLAEANLKVKLTEVAAFYARHHGTTGETLDNVFKLWKASLKAKGRRDKYTDNLLTPLSQLLDIYGRRVMATISKRELDGFFDAVKGLEDPDKPLSPASKHYRYRYARALWSYAKKKEHIGINPFDELEAPELPATNPEVLTVRQAAALIHTARTVSEFKPFLAYCTLGLFCGIRSEELAKLKWSDLRDDTVHITDEISKKCRVRSVPIPRNAQLILEEVTDSVSNDDFILNLPRVGPDNKWMREHKREDGAINFWHRWKAFTKAAGVDPWPSNALRHSFGSYLYKISGNDARLVQDRMGHEQRQTLMNHYIQATPSRLECLEYWKIGAARQIEDALPRTPPVSFDGEGRIVPMEPDWPAILKVLNLAR
jgi:integrase